MTLFNKIYNAIKQFFIYLSCKTDPDYVNLNQDDNIEEVSFIYNNVIS
jgi:hypothetical protein